ncbi:hypothetical protein [Comamonas sp. GB3 AK4-5]
MADINPLANADMRTKASMMLAFVVYVGLKNESGSAQSLSTLISPLKPV